MRSGWRAGILALLLASSTAGAGGCDSLDELRWLLGDWVATTKKSAIHESWREVSPTTFEGVGRTQTRDSGVIVSSESLRLVAMSGDIFYVAKVGHNPLPVAFKLTACTDDRAVFENDNHDFPNRLDYRRVDETTMDVIVSDLAGDGFDLRFTKEPARIRP